jgi:putative ABC transport system ATP-binding protein
MKIEAQRLTKVYLKGTPNEVKAIQEASVKIREGDFFLITGPSGSGKTTLLSLLALLTRPTRGKIFYEDAEVTSYSDAWQTKIRKEKVGFIFQQYNLLPQFSAWENVSLPNLCRRMSKTERRSQAVAIMRQLGLGDRIDFKVAHLSGGEQQRVAIARALVTDPEIVFADEPTASVDDETASAIVGLFRALKKEGRTLIVSTHDISLIREAVLRIELRDGTVSSFNGVSSI